MNQDMRLLVYIRCHEQLGFEHMANLHAQKLNTEYGLPLPWAVRVCHDAGERHYIATNRSVPTATWREALQTASNEFDISKVTSWEPREEPIGSIRGTSPLSMQGEGEARIIGTQAVAKRIKDEKGRFLLHITANSLIGWQAARRLIVET